MASFDPIILTDENAFRAPDKMQSKASRRPLGDVTNSRKPIGNGKSSMKIFTQFKTQQHKVKAPKSGRKPLCDLTNSNKPHANEKLSKKNDVETLSTASEEHFSSWSSEFEGFLHNHDECIKAQKQSMAMSLDYLLETLALKEDPSDLLFTPLPKVAMATDSEMRTSLVDLDKLDERDLELIDVYPPTPTSPASSDFINWAKLSPLKLKESPTKIKVNLQKSCSS